MNVQPTWCQTRQGVMLSDGTKRHTDFLIKSQLLLIVMQMVSRKNEYEANHYATETIDDSISLVDALEKLSASNFSSLTPHPFYIFLNYSPPPLLQRVYALQQYEA